MPELPLEIWKDRIENELKSLEHLNVLEENSIIRKENSVELIVNINENIPFHILAFFPQYKLKTFRSPNLDEILETYETIKEIGLKNVKIGNIGVFAKTDEEMKRLIQIVGPEAI